MKRLLLAAALLLTPVTALAAPVPYAIDASHTQTTFGIDRFGFTSILGLFAQSEGTIWIDEANPAASRVEASVKIASLQTGWPARDEHLQADRWLNAGAHPLISFKSTKVAPTGKDTADVTGDFTLNGVTKPVTFKVKLNKIGKAPSSGKQQAGFTITGQINRQDYGITTGAGAISNTVSIRIEALAVAPTPAS